MIQDMDLDLNWDTFDISIVCHTHNFFCCQAKGSKYFAYSNLVRNKHKWLHSRIIKMKTSMYKYQYFVYYIKLYWKLMIICWYFKSSLETNSSSLIPAPIHNKYFVNANISKYWKILPLQFIPKLCNIGFEIFVKFMTLETLKQNFYTCYETLISIAQDKVN